MDDTDGIYIDWQKWKTISIIHLAITIGIMTNFRLTRPAFHLQPLCYFIPVPWLEETDNHLSPEDTCQVEQLNHSLVFRLRLCTTQLQPIWIPVSSFSLQRIVYRYKERRKPLPVTSCSHSRRPPLWNSTTWSSKTCKAMCNDDVWCINLVKEWRWWRLPTHTNNQLNDTNMCYKWESDTKIQR